MKTQKFPAIVLATLFLALLPPVDAATPVTLQVSATGKDSNEDIKDSNESIHHQTKDVQALVRNMGQQAMEGLSVKFFAFGRDQKSDKQVIFKTEEKKISVEPGKDVTTPFSVGTTYTPEHFLTSNKNVGSYSKGGGAGKQARPVSKKVAGEGIRLIGYGVQLVQGTTVLAEDFQPRGLKDDLASTPAAAKAPPKPKAKAK